MPMKMMLSCLLTWMIIALSENVYDHQSTVFERVDVGADVGAGDVVVVDDAGDAMFWVWMKKVFGYHWAALIDFGFDFGFGFDDANYYSVDCFAVKMKVIEQDLFLELEHDRQRHVSYSTDLLLNVSNCLNLMMLMMMIDHCFLADLHYLNCRF